jgi:hypothetical protein
VRRSREKGCRDRGPSSHSNAVQAAYVVTLERDLATVREELAAVYKTSSQAAHRLLNATEALREKEEHGRATEDELRLKKAEVDRLARKNEELRTVRKEKEKAIEARRCCSPRVSGRRRCTQHLQDELSTLQLEFSQLENRNSDLQNDNKALLQRWLDRMNDEAVQVNEVRPAGLPIVPGSHDNAGQRLCGADQQAESVVCQSVHARDNGKARVTSRLAESRQAMIRTMLPFTVHYARVPCREAALWAQVTAERDQMMPSPKHEQRDPTPPVRPFALYHRRGHV